ncbi:MAG: Crp/Fnr family transcriptional regulator [Caulobacteraceae bacterium]
MTTTTLAALALAGGGTAFRADAGAVIFRPDDACKGFVALSKGVIRVGLTSVNGRQIVLYRVRPGEICLQTFACLAQGRTYAAEGVVEEAVEGVLLAPGVFDTQLRQNSPFRAAVMSSIALRFGDYEELVEALAFTGLESRIAAALLRLADEGGIARTTHEALAAEIGSAREAVSRQLSLMAGAGLVALSRGRVTILRPAALGGLVEAPA